MLIHFITSGTDVSSSTSNVLFPSHSTDSSLPSLHTFALALGFVFTAKPAGLQFAWIATFLFDFLIFLLTIARTYALTRAQSNIMRSSIVMLVMRDGSIYFL